MPLYEYHCEACDREFEVRRPIHQANAPLRCPECASDAVTRKLSLFVSFTKGERNISPAASGGGCACGGACACGGHGIN